MMRAMARFVLAASVGLALTAVLASQGLRAPAREPVVPVEVRHPTTGSEDEPESAPPRRTASIGNRERQEAKTVDRPAASSRSQADLSDSERTAILSSRPGGLDDSDERDGGDEDEGADSDE
jgi:hypothetical protein